MATKTRRLADLLANIDDNSKVTSAGLLDATITASDLAPNSVDSSELVDGAVDTSHIGDLQVTAGKVAANAVTSAKIADANITAAKLSSTALASVEHVKPHIQPGTLYPALSGLLTDNTGFTFTDSSASGHIVRAYGGTQHSGAQSKVGSTSFKFDASTTQRMLIDDHADWDLDGDFTIECYVRLNTLGVQQGIMNLGQDGNDGWRIFSWHNSNGLTVNRDHDDTLDFTITATGGTGVLTVDTWHHLAIVRAGTTVTLYVDGVSKGTATRSGTLTNPGGSLAMGLQYDNSGSPDEYLNGYLDEIRIVKGLAVYTGAFTPQTTALTTTWSAGTNIAANADASKIKLLIHSDAGGHIGAYGTAQADGHSYYYTDIKGSKPIKDPRIGAHFGSQRHKARSIQRLEQETSSQGNNVYSVDGREWFRIVDKSDSSLLTVNYGGNGHDVTFTGAPQLDNSFIEITGYFNDINLINKTASNRMDDIDAYVNGGSAIAVNTIGGKTTVNSPLTSRYVDSGSTINIGSTVSAALGTTPALNTVKLVLTNTSSEYMNLYGIELIVHDKFTDATCDTTNTDATVTMDSTAKLSVGLSVTGTGVPAGASVASITNATTFELSAAATATNANQTFTFGGNDISIPAQNVVSYGKKFSLSAAAHHYNPFAFKTDGSTAWASGAHNGTSWPVGTGSSTNIDTATSLGLENWLHSSNYYKPYNGGRVVKWIASDGTIKTSVNVMPPNAQNLLGTAISAKANASAANDTPLPTFTGVLDQSQTEVSKEYYWREFGNGAANAGGGATAGIWADASMLAGTNDEMAYVMDDGLTALYGSVLRRESVRSSIGFANDLGPTSTNSWNMTFIGTGISILTHENAATGSAYLNIAQNLPYGTHVIKVQRDSSTNSSTWIDGVAIRSNTSGWDYAHLSTVTFHQPKMPPIPEDAVVIADYMLMADFKPQATAGIQYMSKGVRFQSNSRDVYYNPANLTSYAFVLTPIFLGGVQYWNNVADFDIGLTAFGSNFVGQLRQAQTRSKLRVDNVTQTSGTTMNNTNDIGSFGYLDTDVALGIHKFGHINNSGENGSFSGYSIVSPIHTSHHYKSFETPYLHELIGGDRNMEQTHLVVSSDNKTWDEVTRDTSYLGASSGFHTGTDGNGQTTNDSMVMWDVWRGVMNGPTRQGFNKDWAIAWDMVVCLKDGRYLVSWLNQQVNNDSWNKGSLRLNGTQMLYSSSDPQNSTRGELGWSIVLECKRGDYLQIHSEYQVKDDDTTYNVFLAERVG